MARTADLDGYQPIIALTRVYGVIVCAGLVACAGAPGTQPFVASSGLTINGGIVSQSMGPDIKADTPPSVDVTLLKPAAAARKTSSLAGAAFYEFRVIYTEGVVRVPATLRDYHVGLRTRPNFLLGYSLNVPPAGRALPAGTIGAPVLRYAQHTTMDDPLYPSLFDPTKAINPTSDPTIYFLGQGILRTLHSNFPPIVLDPFQSDVPASPIGSVNDIQSAKLGFAATEQGFNTLFANGIIYDDGGASKSALPVVQDRDLTDNVTITPTRYYKFRIPFSSTKMYFGNGLPFGRMLVDSRVLDGDGRSLAEGTATILLQPGANTLRVAVTEGWQGIANIEIEMPKGTSSVLPPPLPVAAAAPVNVDNGGEILDNFSPVYTVAGGDIPGTRDGGPGDSRFDAPVSVAVDQSNNIWVADYKGQSLRKITPSWFAKTLVTDAGLKQPGAVGIDNSGNVILGDDKTYSIFRINPTTGISTLLAFLVGTPAGILVDTDGMIYFSSNSGHFIGKINPATNAVTAIAGKFVTGRDDPEDAVQGSNDGTGNAAQFKHPYGIAWDPGNHDIIVADQQNHKIRRVTKAGKVTTIAGTIPGFLDGPIATARFNEPSGVWMTADGTIYVADRSNCRIRKIAGGQVSTLTGMAGCGWQDGEYVDAKFNAPYHLAQDLKGNLIVADFDNNRVRRIRLPRSSSATGSATP